MAMTECPECDRDDFASRKGMRHHHAIVHGESLRKGKCDYCGEEFIKRSDDTRFCSQECYSGTGLVEVECDQCEEEFTARKNRVENYGRRFCERRCAYDWTSENMVNENHPGWKGGHHRYMGKDWSSIRKDVIERDECCQVCGVSEPLEVHHLIPRRKFDNVNDSNTMDNLVVLCRVCHPKVERGEIEIEVNRSGKQ